MLAFHKPTSKKPLQPDFGIEVNRNPNSGKDRWLPYKLESVVSFLMFFIFQTDLVLYVGETERLAKEFFALDHLKSLPQLPSFVWMKGPREKIQGAEMESGQAWGYIFGYEAI